MATCPAGHHSDALDYCDECGVPMNVAAEQAQDTPPDPGRQEAPETDRRCVVCKEPLDGRFCEECGHDNDLPAPEPGQQPRSRGDESGQDWSVLVQADRAWFDQVCAASGVRAGEIEFPRYCPDRKFKLIGQQLTIGRFSRSRGIVPNIDLTGPPLDPGVSAQHAMVAAHAGGGWDIIDLGSTNGVVIDDGTTPIPPYQAVPLRLGTRIKLGAWTVITVMTDR